MTIGTKELFIAFSYFAKNPSLSVTLFALLIPMLLLYVATKYVGAPVESLLLFGFISIVSLTYSAWVFSKFKNDKS